MNEQELNNVNQIDMECHIVDDDDLLINDVAVADDREVQSKTGIIINFDDDDEVPVKRIIADTSTQNAEININSNFSSNFSEEPFQDYNSIDMETKYSEDDEEEITTLTASKNPIFFDSDDEPSGLVSSEMLEEGKRTVSFGEVEDDYWEKLSKKHKKTNKKGAYNTSFHFAGNPKKEQDIFNHMMGTADDSVDVADLISNDSLLSANTSNVSGTSAATTGAEGGGEGCCESITATEYSKKLNDLFEIVGFEVFKNSDNSYVAIDKCDILPELTAQTLADLISALKPYIDDCLIYPLQLSTNNNFNSYKDWADWYTADMQKAFPKCANDIEYCDLLANHLHECVIE